MIRSTLCYIRSNGNCLMLYRNKKKDDPNAGKWVGIGGKVEQGETPDECLVREVREETGFTLTNYHYHGVVEFRNDKWPDEDMYLYSSSYYQMPEINCDEGDARWIPEDEVLSLDLWEGDRYFLEPLLAGDMSINLRLTYHGDELVSVTKLNDLKRSDE